MIVVHVPMAPPSCRSRAMSYLGTAATDRIRTELEVLDERFRQCDGDAWTQRLFTGCRWTEGPAYFPAGRYLVSSDIPNDRILRFDELTGMVGAFRAPAGYANGHTVDRQGRLISCEHGHRRVTRTEPDGSITVLASHYDGKRLNSPNDVVERSDGTVWFTDPSYGIDSDYEGHEAPSEIGACHVYRVAPETGEVRIAADGFLRPNGLAFSADERQLYIVDTRKKHIRLFDVGGDDAHVEQPDVLLAGIDDVELAFVSGEGEPVGAQESVGGDADFAGLGCDAVDVAGADLAGCLVSLIVAVDAVAGVGE